MPIYSNAINPLDVLQGGKGLYGTGTGGYQFSYLTYPLEFNDKASFGHYMIFYVNVQKMSNYLSGGSYRGSSTFRETSDSEYLRHVFMPAGNNQRGAPSYFPGNYSVVSSDNTLGGNPSTPGGNAIEIPGFGPVSTNKFTQKRISQAIALYIPDSMNFTSTMDWQDASLTEMGGKALKYGQDVGGAIQSAIDTAHGKGSEAARTLAAVASDMILNPTGGGGFGDFALGVGGLAVNPQLFVLFRGVDLRTFQFDFVFTPKSPEEAANVRNIIKAFRFHAAPEIMSGFGRYFIAPSTFNIEYMYQGKMNRNIFQMKTCVLQRIAVDYAPYGWSTYKDGMPVQTVMSMVFKETEIITKDSVNIRILKYLFLIYIINKILYLDT